ncbi:hypothetical protein C8R42DRAFT_718482 [Lentinula raphanica]|nr:hypothetical protein C8R42DRAFT_718482 [Lentinula raphanica]
MLSSIKRHLNFYRIHILFFTFTPLIFSAIFYASNGRFKISYIDALFNCVSAMTVCGLATVDLSSLTPWQQVILFIQMCLGSPVRIVLIASHLNSYFPPLGPCIMGDCVHSKVSQSSTSLTLPQYLLEHRYYFERKFEHIIESAANRKEVSAPSDLEQKSMIIRWSRSLISLLMGRKRAGLPIKRQDSTESSGEKSRKIPKKLRTDMIRRMDDAPKLVNPSGWISEGDRIRVGNIRSPSRSRSPPSDTPQDNPPPVKGIMARRLSDPGTPSRPSSPQGHAMSIQLHPKPPSSPEHLQWNSVPRFLVAVHNVEAAELATKTSRPPSRKASVDLGPGGAPEPAPQRKRLNLLPRTKPVE